MSKPSSDPGSKRPEDGFIAGEPALPRRSIETPRVQAETALFVALEANARELNDASDFGRAAGIEAIASIWEWLRMRGLSGQALKPLSDA